MTANLIQEDHEVMEFAKRSRRRLRPGVRLQKRVNQFAGTNFYQAKVRLMDPRCVARQELRESVPSHSVERNRKVADLGNSYHQSCVASIHVEGAVFKLPCVEFR